jgi:very-short-patch-repair endonuclease
MNNLFVLAGVLVVLVLGIKAFRVYMDAREPASPDLSRYKRKQYIFDSNAEFALYRMLVELYGNQYAIFTQVNYSHLIEPRTSDYKEGRSLRSRIDRKSADFVLCDKNTVVPLLVIELDGYSHNYKSRKARDVFIDEITKVVDLPILHIKTSDANPEYVQKAVDEKLSPRAT